MEGELVGRHLAESLPVEVSPLHNRQAWLEAKKSTIGGSEIAQVLGLSGSRVRLCLQKWGDLEPDPPTEAQELGLKLEPLLAELWQQRTGRTIVKQQVFAVHPEMPWLSCTADCLTSDRFIVQLKAIGDDFRLAQQLGESEDNESLPDKWVAQEQQEMLVLDCPVAFFGVFGPGLRFRTFTLKRHRGFGDMITDEVGRFWHDHVEARVLPQDFLPGDAALLVKAYRSRSGEWLSLGQEALNSAIKFNSIKEEIARLENLRDIEKARLLAAVGNAAGADLPGGWVLQRKVLEINHKAREAHTDSQVRFSVKEPRG